MDQEHIKRILLQQAQIWKSAGISLAPRNSALDLPECHSSVEQHSPVEQVAVPSEVQPTPVSRNSPEISPSNALPMAKQSRKPVSSPESSTSVPTKNFSSDDPWPVEFSNVGVEEKSFQLQELAKKVAGCTLCAELSKARTQTVFGVGNPDARIAFFGEAPGADEDRQGEPFVGRAGKLLTQIIEACGLQREDVYILNTLKCRPPGNRNPSTQENENCRPYFERQLEIIQPEYIVCLGRFAINNLLDTSASISKLRQSFHPYRGSKVVVTYHPAYLLRNPSSKRDVWDDMKMMLTDMGLPIPGKTN